MTRPAGRAAIEIVGDASKLASGLQRDADKALRALDLDTKPISKQLGDAFKAGADDGGSALKDLGRTADTVFRAIDVAGGEAFDSLAEEARTAAAMVATALETGTAGASKVITDEIRSSFAGAVDAGAAVGEAAGQALSAGLQSGADGTNVGTTTAREIVESILAGLVEAKPILLEAGKQIGATVADGIDTSGTTRVRSSSLAMATAVRTGLLTAVTAVGTGLGTLTGFGLKAAGTLEQTQISLDSLTGSVKAGTKAFNDLQAFAAATPFEFPDVTTVAQQFLAFSHSVGLSQKDLIPFLTTLGDVASVTGVGAAGMQHVALAFGQVASAGRLLQGDLRQISTNLPGFSGVAAIAAARGETTAQAMQEISQGTISAQEGIRDLLAGMRKFPGAAGAMEKQSQTLLGVLSTFKDVSRQALSKAFAPVIPQIKASLAAITPIVGTALNQLAPVLGGLVARLLPLLTGLLQGLIPILTPILNGLATALGQVTPALVPLGTALGTVAAAVAPLLPQLVSLGLAFLPLIEAAVQLAPPLLTLLVPALQLVLTLVQPMLPALTALATLLAGPLGTATRALAGPLAAITSFFATNPTLVWLLAAAIGGYVLSVKGLVLWQNIANAATKAWTVAQAALDVVLDANPIGLVVIAIAALIAGAILAYKHVSWFKTAVDATWHALLVAGKAIGSFAVDAWHAISGFFVGAAHVVVGAADAIHDFFAGLGRWLESLPSKIGAFFVGLGHWFAELPGRIGAFLASLPGVVARAGRALFDALLTAVGAGIGLLLAAMIGIPKLIAAGLSAGASAVVAGAQALGHLIVVGFDNAITWLTALPGKVWEVISAIPGLIARGFRMVLAFDEQLFNAILNLAIQVGTSILTWVEALPGRVWSFIKTIPGFVADVFRSAFAFARAEVTAGIEFVISLIRSVPGRIVALKDLMVHAGLSLIQGFMNGLRNVGHFLSDVAGDIVSAVKGGLNHVIDKINDGIAAVDAKVPFDLPRIPRLARGGLTQGTGLAFLHPTEAVLPLEDVRVTDLLARALREAQQGLQAVGVPGAGGGGDITIRVYLGTREITDIVDVQIDERNRALRRRVTAGPRR